MLGGSERIVRINMSECWHFLTLVSESCRLVINCCIKVHAGIEGLVSRSEGVFG